MWVRVAVIISKLWNFNFKKFSLFWKFTFTLVSLIKSLLLNSNNFSVGNATFQYYVYNYLTRVSSFHYLQNPSTYDSPESGRKTEGPALQKGLDAIASSLNYIGGTIGKSLEVGFVSLIIFKIIVWEDGFVRGLCFY